MWRELLSLKTWRATARENLPYLVPSMILLLVLWWFGPDIIPDAGAYLRGRVGEGGAILIIGGSYVLIVFVALVLARARGQAEWHRRQDAEAETQVREDDHDRGQ